LVPRSSEKLKHPTSIDFFYLVGSSGQVLDGEVPTMTWHSFQWLLHSVLPRGGVSGSPDGPMCLLPRSMVQDPPTLWVIWFDPGGRRSLCYLVDCYAQTSRPGAMLLIP
jgi:hypothetical protein